jgi:hypothetical protein
MKVNSGRKDPAGVKHGGKLSGCRNASYSPLCSFVSFVVQDFSDFLIRAHLRKSAANRFLFRCSPCLRVSVVRVYFRNSPPSFGLTCLL